MHVLMFSTDAKILEDGTDARRRMVEYGSLFDALYVVVLCARNKTQGAKSGAQMANGPPATQDSLLALRAGKWQIVKDGNTFIYPTNSRWKIARLWDAYKIGKSVIRNCLALRDVPEGQKLEIGNCAMSAQDPFETGLVGYLLKRKFNIPLQVQAHTDFFSPYFWRESLKNKARVALAKFLLPRADGIRVVSERIKKSLSSVIGHRSSVISVLPIFVDVEKLRMTPAAFDLRKNYPQFSFIVLVASRLTTEKNVGLAISAMREVVKKYPHAGLVIVGDGPERRALEFQISNFKLQMNVVLEPWTNDLASYYKGADVYLLTSNYEGYGRTAVEAAACGLPVVMTDVGLAGEFIVDGFNGIVCPVGNASAVTEALIRLIEKPSLRQEMGAHQREVLAQLPTKDFYLSRYKTILEQTISRGI